MRFKLVYRSLIIPTLFVVASCHQNNKSQVTSENPHSLCTDSCIARNMSTGEIACKLTSPELQERKSTVIASLKRQIREKRELGNGFAYRFGGDDKTVDELVTFIKTERQCCNFFTFNLSISGDRSEAWLELTGPVNAKQFISAELDF